MAVPVSERRPAYCLLLSLPRLACLVTDDWSQGGVVLVPLPGLSPLAGRYCRSVVAWYTGPRLRVHAAWVSAGKAGTGGPRLGLVLNDRTA